MNQPVIVWLQGLAPLNQTDHDLELEGLVEFRTFIHEVIFLDWYNQGSACAEPRNPWVPGFRVEPTLISKIWVPVGSGFQVEISIRGQNIFRFFHNILEVFLMNFWRFNWILFRTFRGEITWIINPVTEPSISSWLYILAQNCPDFGT